MIRKYLLPVLAIAGVLLGIRTTQTSVQTPPPAEPVSAPSRDPYEHSVAGSGIVEGISENVRIAPFIGGVVAKIPVSVGQFVKKGEVLFELDLRTAEANLRSQEAALLLAQAEYRSAQALLGLLNSISDKRAISEEEKIRRRFAVETAGATVKLRERELSVAQTNLDLHTVRAPFDGTVLQIRTRLGEFAQAQAIISQEPLMLFADISQLQVRVDIDEADSWRLESSPEGTAFIRGNPELNSRLSFVKIEPYVIPKRALTGESSERVDTRVLQVIFRFPADALPVYPGQLMDVFIKGKPFREVS